MIAKPVKTSRGIRYPWAKWLRRKRLTLVRGVHYHCLPSSMAMQIRVAAFHRGYHVSVHLGERDTITVEVSHG